MGISLNDPELWTALGTDNVRIFPSPVSTTDASLQLARQMARLLIDAKQQINAAARDAATNAVSAERHTAFEQWEQKFAAARVEVVNEAERAIVKIQREAAEQAKHVVATAEELAEKTRSELPRTLAPQLQELAQGVAQEVSGKLAEQSAAQQAQSNYTYRQSVTIEELDNLWQAAHRFRPGTRPRWRWRAPVRQGRQKHRRAAVLRGARSWRCLPAGFLLPRRWYRWTEGRREGYP